MSTRAQLLAEIAAQFPDNTTGLITPAKLRQVVEDVTNSCLVSETDAGTAGIAVLQAETPAQGRTALGFGETIVTNMDEDYVTPELTQNTKLYFAPSEDRTCDITAGAASVGTKLFLYHSGSGNFKETVTYATGKSLVMTQKMFYELEKVPDGWLITDSNSKDFIDWNECPYTVAYSATIDATNHIYEFTVTGDKTSYFTANKKIRFKQGTIKYGIITYVETSGGNTILTVYGGTDYAYTSDAITEFYIAKNKSPFGFNTDKAKWGIIYGVSSYSKENAVQGTFYYTNNTLKIFKGSWSVFTGLSPFVISGTSGVSTITVYVSQSKTSNLNSVGSLYLAGCNNIQCYLNDVRQVSLSENKDYYILIRNPESNGHEIGLVGFNSRIELYPCEL